MSGRWFFLVPLLGLLRASLPSPAPATTPLFTFLQQHFDSTVLYQSGSNWNTSPNYLILAKHQNRVAFCTYRSPYQNVLGQCFPGQLVQKFSQEEARFRATTPDTNRYLLPQRVAADSLHCCGSITCGPFKAMHRRVESRGTVWWKMVCLIVKQTTRHARFYAPAFLEACVGKEVSRQ